MKKFIFTLFIAMFSLGIFAQPIPPPINHGSTGDQQGAPLDGGISILMLLGAAYGAKKVHKLNAKETIIKE